MKKHHPNVTICPHQEDCDMCAKSKEADDKAAATTDPFEIKCIEDETRP